MNILTVYDLRNWCERAYKTFDVQIVQRARKEGAAYEVDGFMALGLDHWQSAIVLWPALFEGADRFVVSSLKLMIT